jgi:autotransporter strand-loop-strand O-heptosyltransferase
MINENIYIDGSILGLGDSIAAMPIVDIYANLNKDKKIFFSNKFYFLFSKEYTHINFLQDNQNFFTKNEQMFLCYNDTIYDIKEVYSLAYTGTHTKKEANGIIRVELKNKRLSLQEHMADILNLRIKDEIKPKISFNPKPILMENIGPNGYVCIATQTTIQAKYWNYPNGWKNIVNFLNVKGYSVICVDQHRNYGNLVYRNYIPENCIDYTGLPLKELSNIIYNCSFFIGLDSGLSWLAWALDKKVIQILGLTGERIAFKNPYAILNKNVCNSCYEDISIEKFSSNNPFDDFLLCPRHKNTKRMFECTKKITSDMVINTIRKALKEK